MKLGIRAVFITILVSLSCAHAMEWQQLDMMRLAVQQQDYRGEYIHRRGDESSAYSIVHRFDGQKATELLSQLDGDMIEVLRNDQQVICYLPKGSEEALTHAIPAAPYSQVNAMDLQRIANNYHAMTIGTARVAGYLTDIIELTGDTWRYTHRLWLEQGTKLLLQSELVDEKGQVLEQFRYTRVELGVQIESDELKPSLAGQQNVLQQTAFRDQPVIPDDSTFVSVISWLPSGYELTHSEQKMQERGWLEQRTYSDGLTSFSVFVERGDAVDGQQSALAKMGATTALMTFQKGLSITVIGEVPDQTAKKIAQMVTIQATL